MKEKNAMAAKTVSTARKFNVGITGSTEEKSVTVESAVLTV